jgi:hypothetical protein
VRLGCDPLHRHLLPPDALARPSWQPIQGWREQIRAGVLDGALISVAGLSVGTALDGPAQQLKRRAAAELVAESALAGSGITAVALGDLPLVLVHAGCHRQALEEGARVMQWKLLLPTAEQQPLLWNELEQLGLLPLQECRDADAESWLTHLQTEPHLLPADLSLLEGRPWCEEGLLAVPPPEPLAERLWLLIHEGDAEQPQLTDLIETLRLQILMRHPSQP